MRVSCALPLGQNGVVMTPHLPAVRCQGQMGFVPCADCDALCHMQTVTTTVKECAQPRPLPHCCFHFAPAELAPGLQLCEPQLAFCASLSAGGAPHASCCAAGARNKCTLFVRRRPEDILRCGPCLTVSRFAKSSLTFNSSASGNTALPSSNRLAVFRAVVISQESSVEVELRGA